MMKKIVIGYEVQCYFCKQWFAKRTKKDVRKEYEKHRKTCEKWLKLKNIMEEEDKKGTWTKKSWGDLMIEYDLTVEEMVLFAKFCR